MARLFPFRHLLPGLASAVQLDLLRTYHQLSGDVCPLDWHGHFP